MAEVIKLNYPAMREMVLHCRKVAQRLQQTVQMGRGIANQMQNGALVGAAGMAFVDALNTKFTQAVTRLSQKFEEEAKDIEGAIADMQAQDSSVQGKFR